ARAPAAPPTPTSVPPARTLAEGPVDVSLWSEVRVKEWKESLAVDRRTPLAILKMPRLKIDVPVLEGTDDLTLNRGAGWIEGTSRPGETGNVGLSAHRDGFFRALKDVAAGDEVVLETPRETTRYAVAWTKIVDPDDVSVLDETGGAAVTLVTCYPFYYVGSAPQRLIVRATPLTAAPVPTSGPRP
ncbi:MAG TPA: class D sortase, partial [Thermoanaerobaculia bacterium]|nr:class D sortase [Thermoanaerobaculia bacterium]